MFKRQLKSREILQDIRSGMLDDALMQKHGMSARGLQSVITKLIAGGALIKGKRHDAPHSPERTMNTVWKCPVCGELQEPQFETCLDCGIIIPKFLKIRDIKFRRAVEDQDLEDEERSTGTESGKDDAERPGFCHECGQELDLKDLFCPHCRAPIRIKQDHINQIQDIGPHAYRLFFFQSHALTISVAMIVVLVFGILAFKFNLTSQTVEHENSAIYSRSDVGPDDLKLYEPMRNEIVRDRKTLETGLSISEHNVMVNNFVRRFEQLQLVLKGQKPELVSLLQGAIENLRDAEDAWNEEIDCEVQAREHFCTPCSSEDLYAQIHEKAGTDDHGNLAGPINRAWTAAINHRESAWSEFTDATEKALSIMTGK